MTVTDSVSLLRWSFLISIPTATFLSFILYIFLAPRNPNAEGKLKLPVHENGGRNGYVRVDGDGEEEEEKNDPFDIVDEEVKLDGYPIEEDTFWRKVSWRAVDLESFFGVRADGFWGE